MVFGGAGEFESAQVALLAQALLVFVHCHPAGEVHEVRDGGAAQSTPGPSGASRSFWASPYDRSCRTIAVVPDICPAVRHGRARIRCGLRDGEQRGSRRESRAWCNTAARAASESGDGRLYA